MRSWKTLLKELPLRNRTALLLAAGVRIGSLKPIDLVREAGLRLVHEAVSGGVAVEVGGEPAGFPHSGGRWEEAAEETVGWWEHLVFGRKRGRS
jgi:hypothetical protein